VLVTESLVLGTAFEKLQIGNVASGQASLANTATLPLKNARMLRVFEENEE
jgi:hypothetical protein